MFSNTRRISSKSKGFPNAYGYENPASLHIFVTLASLPIPLKQMNRVTDVFLAILYCLVIHIPACSIFLPVSSGYSI